MTVAHEAPPALAVRGLSKVFGARRALDDVSFELPQGAFLSIFGHNGAGKTTLLRILSTLMRPTAGSAAVLGLSLKEKPDEVRGHIGLISHRSMLYPDLSAAENLLLTARLYGIPDAPARVDAMLAAVELTARRHDVVRSFSRGMTQRLSIARALLHDPRLVFLDEPYSGLDPHAVEILDGLIALAREGSRGGADGTRHTECDETVDRAHRTPHTARSLVMVSHDLRKGFDLSSHVLMLAKGRVVLFGEKDALAYEQFAELYRSTVGVGVS